jgi:hypothetical protein
MERSFESINSYTCLNDYYGISGTVEVDQDQVSKPTTLIEAYQPGTLKF